LLRIPVGDLNETEGCRALYDWGFLRHGVVPPNLAPINPASGYVNRRKTLNPAPFPLEQPHRSGHAPTTRKKQIPMSWLLACLITGTLAPAVPAQTSTTTNTTAVAARPAMHWADDASGRPFSKDPSVIYFGGRYLMYYSLPGAEGGGMQGWSVGIAESLNLIDWKKTGAVGPGQECDKLGLAAPAAWVHEGKVHLFYQTYGNGRKDAICHAWSTNGIHWQRVFDQPLLPNGQPGSWNASESGHPGIFTDTDGTHHLFFQGNNDMGKTWYLSKVRIVWKDGLPAVADQ
jgi:hypothetical protein